MRVARLDVARGDQMAQTIVEECIGDLDLTMAHDGAYQAGGGAEFFGTKIVQHLIEDCFLDTDDMSVGENP